MKAVILAGGLGTRISEESHLKPKPMIEVGGKPILWHIMKIYSSFGVNDFVICCGYKGYVIKEYFANYFLHNSDVTFDMQNNTMTVHDNHSEPWKVTLVDTGLETGTLGRLRFVERYLSGEKRFHFTYGDGVSDINLNKLLESHQASNRLITVTAVQPPGRFGALKIKGNDITEFQEKPTGDNNWISGGFFVIDNDVFKQLSDFQSSEMWEQAPMEFFTQNNQVNCFKHQGFWQPMDTLRDKNYLEDLFLKQEAPWATWEK
ncbi:glucose-1-phosphate cytidylyltransferase [Catenovulum sp. SM1970]|uniref:glucose-1-phosphate cytidylyltransferase n=1 Tax=Marinifaba aquimaris TaxID=2741323 RepID=UPI001573AA80|nr:glucose-1-phosphate cytidylyltransferase [Marinifaba aquimaris]NTS75354.1 glucose-1-phosphate cytidylyltransferase [Marinifaba aquimaris]